MNQEAFPPLRPERLLSELFSRSDRSEADAPARGASRVVLPTRPNRPWMVSWDGLPEGERRDILREALPPVVGFSTSGHTGRARIWARTWEQLMAEVDLLVEICRLGETDGVITFAPLHHLYGFLVSFLIPAVRGQRVWFWPMDRVGPLTFAGIARPLVAAIPSAMVLLDRGAEGLRAYRSVTVVHSTAMLPPAGRSLLEKLSRRQFRLIELFGSTETGLIATRANAPVEDAPWELAGDVELIRLEPEGSEAPLRVRGPRLAYDETGTQLAEWELDDVVRDIGDRRFVFEGRRSLLVNINGRRVYLDRVEDSLRAAVPCRDLACLPVRDDVRGEGFDVLIVPDTSRPLTATEARERWTAALAGVGQPRRIDLVEEIDRSSTGKLLLDRP